MNVVIGDVNDVATSPTLAPNSSARVLRSCDVDVTDRESVAKAADAAVAAFGRIHVLCNNAGIAGGGAVADPGFADWDRAMAVNLGGAVNVVKTFVPLIREHRQRRSHCQHVVDRRDHRASVRGRRVHHGEVRGARHSANRYGSASRPRASACRCCAPG